MSSKVGKIVNVTSRLWTAFGNVNNSDSESDPVDAEEVPPTEAQRIVNVTERLAVACGKVDGCESEDEILDATLVAPTKVVKIVDVTARLATAFGKVNSSDSESELVDAQEEVALPSKVGEIVDVTARLFTAFDNVESSDDERDDVDLVDATSKAATAPENIEQFPIFLPSLLLGYRASMSPKDYEGDASLASICQAKLQATTYENASSKSKVVFPTRHHQPLTPTTGSWSVQHRKSTDNSLDDVDKVGRAARSILNKITAETFDSFFQELVTCGIEKPQHIEKLMSEVFDSATKQHHFIPMYADLCMKLEKDPRIATVVEVAGEQHNFRRLLLNQCQCVFEQLLEPCDDDIAADEEACSRRKQEALGNMKLIGHLLANGMLSSKLLVDCADELLSKRTRCPEALEALAVLMMIAAPTFDTTEWQHYDKLETCFINMRQLVKEKTVPPRNRFLMRDVLDMREAGWPTSTKNPSVIADEAATTTTSPSAKTSTPSPATLEGSCFDLKTFRRTLAAVLGDLTSDRNVPVAVKRLRLAAVPLECQAEQFADLITRIVEEKRGPPRRCAMAFLAGLATADGQSAFDRDQCLAGLVSFFQDVYPDLCQEVPRLPQIVKSELTPTLCSVFPTEAIHNRLPPGVRF